MRSGRSCCQRGRQERERACAAQSTRRGARATTRAGLPRQSPPQERLQVHAICHPRGPSTRARGERACARARVNARGYRAAGTRHPAASVARTERRMPCRCSRGRMPPRALALCAGRLVRVARCIPSRGQRNKRGRSGDFSSEKAKLFFLLGLRPRERSRPPPCMAAAAGPREARVQRDCTRACSVACGFCTGTGLSLLATASTGRCFESPLSCTIPVSLDMAPLGVGSRRHAWTLGPTLTNSLLNSLIRARCVDDGALGDARGSGHPV